MFFYSTGYKDLALFRHFWGVFAVTLRTVASYKNETFSLIVCVVVNDIASYLSSTRWVGYGFIN